MHTNKRSFINLSDIRKEDLYKILKRATQLKNKRLKSNSFKKSLANINLAMIFEKPSTRTRVSFEIAIKELGDRQLY